MSASLVGSEMCIRDRSASLYFSLPLPPLGRPRAPRSHNSQNSTAFEPVSYTHLTLPTICSV
eukprot:9433007-Alexandrium_andersonii.AAC.1